MKKQVIVIGSGFAGLSAASFMAKAGWDVTVLEKHRMPGGRARKMEVDGFVFDMGPSWYWMPDVFERYFAQFGKKVSDYYQLIRLDPSYRVYFSDGSMDIPASLQELQELFESIEPGAGKQLEKFLKEAAFKYEMGIQKLVYKPGQSLSEFMDINLLKGIFKLDVFSSMKKHIANYFTHPKLIELMEFPVLFLGALPENTPALYSLMNYADIKGGTWFPKGGMYQVVNAMYQLAIELGVHFQFDQEVVEIKVVNGLAETIICKNALGESSSYQTDYLIAGADYHHVESKLLSKPYQTYSENYWNTRVMAPSCLLFFLGLNKKLKDMPHHTLFFDTDFKVHGKEIYQTKVWPSNPLFYLGITSVTDSTTAPEGCENLFLLIPVAPGLTGDTEMLRDQYFQLIVDRLEKQIGQTIRESIVYKKSYAQSDFINDYHSFKGNAYGLANTLLQTAILKPSCVSKKVDNLFFTGQLTVPGPGVPPSLISGELVAGVLLKKANN